LRNLNIIENYLWDITSEVNESLNKNKYNFPHRGLFKIYIPGEYPFYDPGKSIKEYKMKSAFRKIYAREDYECVDLRDNFIMLRKINKHKEKIEAWFDLYPTLDRLSFHWEFEYSQYNSSIDYEYFFGENIDKIDLILENFLFFIDICEKEIVGKFNLLFDLN